MTHNRKPDVLPVEGASIADALAAALSTLDQAAGETEVAERAIVVGSEWKGETREHVCKVTEVSQDVIGHVDERENRTLSTRDNFLRHHTWLSDPEATESAPPKGST